MDSDHDNEDIDVKSSTLKLTSYGVEYPCMKNRKSIQFDDFYARYNKFKRIHIDNYNKNKRKTDDKKKSFNDRLLTTCFICDIYIVSNLSLRRRYLGLTTIIPEICLQINQSPNKSTSKHNHSDLRYCILEKLGRAGIKGLLQTDLILELNTKPKVLFSAIKHLQHLS